MRSDNILILKLLRAESARLFDFLPYFTSQLSFEGLREYLFSIRCSCSICFLWDTYLVGFFYNLFASVIK